MSAAEVIAEIEALPDAERERVMDYFTLLRLEDIPESFRRGMADALAGRLVDMETVLSEPPPSVTGK
jgi:hypothetical protein